jgi:membrane protease subunit HflC
MSGKSLGLLIVLGLAIIVGSQSLFIVKETETALTLQFGQIVESDIAAGLHIKTPFLQNVKKFDARILTLDAQPARFLTAGKKYVIVDAFVKWRIQDVLKYYKATSGDRFEASNRLADLANKGLRNEFGVRSLHEVVSGERDQLMTKLTADLNKETQEEFGIEVLDVRVKAIDLPEELSNDVYRRMRAERDREAKEIRSEGNELAEGIRAEADRNKTVTLANAYRESEQIKGEGDATAANIYSKAYSKDSEFYAFTRSLKAYTETFRNQDVLLLKPDSDFFRYMKDSKGK